MTIRRWHLELLVAEAAVGFIRRIMHGNSADYLELLVAHLLAEVAVLELALQPDGLGGPRLQFGAWG